MPQGKNRNPVSRAVLGATITLFLVGPVRADFDWTNVGGFGTPDFNVDAGSVGDYTQTASQITFNSVALGDSIYGTYTPSNWSAYADFGIRISLTTNPNQPFNFFIYDSTYEGGATGVNTYSGLSSVLDGNVIRLTLLSSTANLGSVIGVGFGWNGDSTTDLVATHVAAIPQAPPPPPPSTGGSFTARAPGGVRFLTTDATGEEGDPYVGVELSSGQTSWNVLSDRNAKTDVTMVDHLKVLQRVSALPITSWQYKHDSNRRYVGPMAQDFHGAFGLGHDDKHISTLDADGVIISALKGLIAELQERKERSATQARRLQELRVELERLQKLLTNLPPASAE